ncbi:MAG: tRNA (adenosine(37)-N6)-threonylcarbamoyltransferase complex dimerization subunit type 1 TsaB [Actinobacteria bacterium RBG_13_63_9]|nr:MAG: tRNA (adenosine(37)-N6)-threonylcarbamoyltransferase complex dimerization subunit type 1 TsaB [Actinobacteria bacterium RBG_13_63_9]
MTDRLALALDGSTRVCSAALLLPAGAGKAGGRLVGGSLRAEGRRGGRLGEGSWEVVARRAEVDGRGQAKVLLRLVDEMLEQLGAGPAELGAIVAGVGPGTFTGVRITVATARGLALALAIPVFGVSTLSALAAGAAAGAGAAGAAMGERWVPVVDARRGQVFFGVYEACADPGRSGRVWTRSEDLGVCDRVGFGEMLAGRGWARALVVGEDRSLVGDLPPEARFLGAEVEAECLVRGQELVEEGTDLVQRSRVSRWLLEAFTREPFALSGATRNGAGVTLGPDAGGLGTPEALRPIYVRSPDADVHITKMKDPWADDSHRT